MSDIPTTRRRRKTTKVLSDTARMGKRGTIVIPARVRREAQLEEGQLVVVEAVAEGVLVRPAVALPIESYSNRRKAEFLLNNAVDAQDYRKARKAVESLGIDPDAIPHNRPVES